MLAFFRRLIERAARRGEPGHADANASESEEGLRDRLIGLLPGTGPDPRDIAEKGATHLGEAKNRTSAWIRRGTDSARDAARQAGERIQAAWAPESSGRILQESPLFEPLPGEAERIAPELLSLTWRNEALLALSSAGVLSLEDEIIRHTDRLFHRGIPTPELSERIFRRDFSELHRWIDTVPGNTVAGGGITHRLEHGHDLQSAAEIYQKHGLEGVLVWTQHVGQDLFSSTGVPLPAGGKGVARFLVDEGYASPGKAALLVSFNAAELAAGFLAGTFALRLAGQLRVMNRRRQVQKRCAAALRAWRRDDLDAVIDNYAEARSLGDDPALSLALGWAYRQTGRPAAESFLELRRAALELGSEDRMIELDGAAISLRGLAYLLALVEAPQVLRREDLEGAWRQELGRMVRGAVASFEVAAISQSERPGVSVGERSFEWRPRPLSAAANYYLAARSVVAAPFTSSSDGIDRLRINALQTLQGVEFESGEAQEARLSAVAARWEAALATDVTLLSG